MAVGYKAAHSLARSLGVTRTRYPRLALFSDVVHLPRAIWELVSDQYQRAEAFDREYDQKNDPWGYRVLSFEQERHRVAAAMLRAASANQPFSRILEIGCGEGVFTELLATNCNSLLAVDFSRVALDRARKHKDWGGSVAFQEWDLRRDPMPGHFDLIVAMDVLMYVRRPNALGGVIDKMIRGMRPGDLMLVGNPYEEDVFRYWWGKFFMRGRWAIAALAARPELEVVSETTTEAHVLALLRRV